MTENGTEKRQNKCDDDLELAFWSEKSEISCRGRTKKQKKDLVNRITPNSGKHCAYSARATSPLSQTDAARSNAA